MKKLFLLFLLAGLLAGMLAGCENDHGVKPPNGGLDGYDTGVYGLGYAVDRSTGVVYLYSWNEGGITVMLNADGTPVTKEQLGLK